MELLFTGLVLCGSMLGGDSWGISSEKKVQYASWDEMNIIAHGLLQLGHGLKEHVDKTKSQLKEITGRLSQHNVSLVELIKQTKEVKESGDMLKGRVQELGDRDRQLFDLSQGLKDKVQEISSEKQQLDQRLKDMEDKIQLLELGKRQNRSDKDDILSMQSQMDTQNERIMELLEKIKLQQLKLDKQNQQIKNLQTKIQGNISENQKLSLHLKKEASLEKPTNDSIEAETERPPSDCHQIFLEGERTSGIFTVKPSTAQPFEVYCEITGEEGWTVIQRRSDGSVDFDQLWEQYRNGFGALNGEFWLGLEKIHQITKQGRYVIRIELQDWEENIQYMESEFHLGGSSTAYALQVFAPVTGDLENALSDFRSQAFSTRDHDKDLKPDINCAKHLSGGWWFSACGHSNLNGKYFRSIPRQRHERKQGIFWKTWKGRYYPLKSTSIKIHPIEFETPE
ncbi:angiopoietin-related protein 4 [Spea bombifrons]|uniref:angiopoietin-related protein 4 n=1 Tax=Spea bombifrons TaxID=233779 RepID=UPI00234BE98A|nr:angiopoietin-related protein 4 [Spea bombifrons]